MVEGSNREGAPTDSDVIFEIGLDSSRVLAWREAKPPALSPDYRGEGDRSLALPRGNRSERLARIRWRTQPRVDSVEPRARAC